MPKHWKKNSTINVRSQGRLQRHNKRGETKGTEIKRFILRREGEGQVWIRVEWGQHLDQSLCPERPSTSCECVLCTFDVHECLDVILHHNWMLWMSTASLGFVRCERNPHEPQDGFVQTLLSRVDLKGARRLMTAWDKNVNFVELLKEDSLLEIETDIFTFSALSNSFSDTQW